MRLVNETRAAKKQWEDILKAKNAMIIEGSERMRRFPLDCPSNAHPYTHPPSKLASEIIDSLSLLPAL